MGAKTSQSKAKTNTPPYFIMVVWPLESGSNVAKAIDGVSQLLTHQYRGKYLVLSQIYTNNMDLVGLRHQLRTDKSVEILQSDAFDKKCLQFYFIVHASKPTD